ncbi:hypothetical protein LWI29_000771 [Acer saccharum]|uniref:Amino acid transporter transmembrane domain-containing protein n=1 Tax=Acer saccharum TaxID=4024 RepID=A0AA39RA49_ACESA|nr:hypothetical protein LWI29_000771 [Acer saccharum]
MGDWKVAEEGIDDDGRSKRTGTMWTASAHIITAIVGSGVLSLAWSMAQLGWLAGVATLFVFSAISLYTSSLLADCYRDPLSGNRNHTYMETVKTFLEIFLSQIRNFHKLSWLSAIAAVMSFSYAGIGIGLSFAKVVSGEGEKTSLTGVEIGLNLTAADKTWRMFQAMGDMALSVAYSVILIEVQDTLRSSPPENRVMKKANVIATSAVTTLYMLCGCLGYAALGNHAPGNLLTGFGFYEPFWLIDLANVFIVVHLIGAYQIVVQPVFQVVESWAGAKLPKSKFVNEEYPLRIGKYNNFTISLNFFRIIWRSVFIMIVTLISMAVPFFNEILALLGAFCYWPLTVYFPLEMYISRTKIKRGTIKWCALRLLNLVCFLAGLAVAISSFLGIGKALHTYKPFMSKQ